MEALNQWLDAIKTKHGHSSDSELARYLGLTRTAISNYRRGVSLPSDEVIGLIAQETGEPLAKVVGVVYEARALSNSAKRVWRRLAATAACLMLAAGLHPAEAFTAPGQKADILSGASAQGVYIMRSLRRWLRKLRIALAAASSRDFGALQPC